MGNGLFVFGRGQSELPQDRNKDASFSQRAGVLLEDSFRPWIGREKLPPSLKRRHRLGVLRAFGRSNWSRSRPHY